MFLYQWKRPDLCHTRTFSSRYLHTPGVKTWTRTYLFISRKLEYGAALVHVLDISRDYRNDYTRDIARLGLRKAQYLVHAFGAQTFVVCHNTARSTSGSVILMDTGAISWYSECQMMDSDVRPNTQAELNQQPSRKAYNLCDDLLNPL